MLGDLSSNYEEVTYSLVLKTIGRSTIGELYGVRDLEVIDIFSNDQPTISFTLDKYVDGELNVNYSEITDKRQILLRKNNVDYAYYSIENIDEDVNYENSSKDIICRSIEYNLAEKKINALDGTYTIQEVFNLSFGVKAISWSIGYISTSLTTLYRTFDISSTSLLDLCYSYIQNSYGCIVRFDTLNKEVDFYALDDIPSDMSIFISFENFQKYIGKDSLSGKIKTIYNVYGKDDLRINAVNLTGNQIFNYDYFKGDMSTSLLSALNTWEALLSTNESVFTGYLSDLDTYNKQLYGTGDVYAEEAQGGSSTTITLGLNAVATDDYYNGREIFIISGTGDGQKRTITDYVGSTKVATVSSAWTTTPDSTSNIYIREIIGLEIELDFLGLGLLVIQTVKDSKIVQGVEYSTENALESAKQTQIDNKQTEIDDVNSNISDTYDDIATLSALVSESNNFTSLQLEELDGYKFEDDYIDDGYYVSANATFEEEISVKNQLKSAGETELAKNSVPRFTVKLDLADILTMIEFQYQRGYLTLGAVATVEYSDGVTLESRIVAINHRPESQKLEITLSNTYRIDDDTFSFFIENREDKTATINNHFERDSYNYYLKNDASDVQNFINSSINTSSNPIISTIGDQEVTIDERGIWLRKIDETEPSGYDPNQLRLLSNVIVFSTDGFQTSQLAITAEGINGVIIEDGTLNISSFFVAPEGVVKGLTVSHLRTIDSDFDEETTNYIEIIDKRMSFITGQRLFWTDSSKVEKTIENTLYPTIDLQTKSLLENPMFIQIKSDNPEDDMTTTPNNYPVWVHTKTGESPLYYTDEVSSSTSIIPTLVNITTPDEFDDESYYLPVVSQYQIGGNNAYWTDEPTLSIIRTDYPSMTKQYNKYTKLNMSFDGAGVSAIPKIQMGTGTGVGDNGKSFIYKGLDGFYIDYRNSITGDSTIFKITDDGIDLSQFSNVNFNSSVILDGLVQFYIQNSEPLSAKENDGWIDTDNYSRYDILEITTTTTLNVTGEESIEADGTFTITLFTSIGNEGVVRRIKNVGTGTVTIDANGTETIDGNLTVVLDSNDSIEIESDGLNWKIMSTNGSGGGSGSTTFLGLTDAPSSFSGQASKLVAVNSGETALEFVASGGGTSNPFFNMVRFSRWLTAAGWSNAGSGSATFGSTDLPSVLNNSNYVQGPTWSVLKNPTVSGDNYIATNTGNGIKMNAGKVYRFSCWGKTTGTTDPSYLRLIIWNSSGGVVADAILDFFSDNSDWNKIEVAYTAPTNAYRAEIRLMAPGTGSYYFAGLQCNEGNVYLDFSPNPTDTNGLWL